MTQHTSSIALALCALFAASSELSAQLASPGNGPLPPSRAAEPGHVRLAIPGKVLDLTRDGLGRVLYCTAERDVGRVELNGSHTLLASPATAFFPFDLCAIAVSPVGNVAVVDSIGSVRVLLGGAPPAALVYDESDLYMVSDPTDLILDGRSSFLLASATPSPGQRAVNWVRGDGQRWSYYMVRHQPLALAHDPLTGGLLVSETTAGGNIQLVQAGSPIRATSGIDTTTHPGVNALQSDGDLAVEADGDIYWIAGGTIRKRNRAAGTTTTFASGYGQLRGAVIARSSVLATGGAGWSLYVSEGASPSLLREFPGVGTPASLIASDQGEVPWKGRNLNLSLGMQCFELTADNQGRLLLGGAQFGSPRYVKRVTLGAVPAITTLATGANGLVDIVEGLAVAPDDSIYALARNGTIQRITEGPLAITTVFSDPANQITAGKDLTLDVDGTLYIAARENWDFGKVMAVSGGVASLLSVTEETRGLAANPLGGMLVSQWHHTGFNGTVDLLHFDDNSLELLPGFATMNYTNDFVWGDGDVCVDAEGTIYTVSEDDWSLVRYRADLDGIERIGSGYLNHPSGLAIAPSTPAAGSTTGWSLYVSEFDFLWEKPSFPPPAATLVDSSLGLSIDRTLAAAPHPSFGKPTVLGPAPRGAPGVLVGTATGWVLAVDPWSGAVQPIAGPEQGLRGELRALSPALDGGILAVNAAGERSWISARGRVLTLASRETEPGAPRRTLRTREPATGQPVWLALEGWALWRVR
jgi:hypothetical protein